MDKILFPYSDDSSDDSATDDRVDNLDKPEKSPLDGDNLASTSSVQNHLEKFAELQKRRQEMCEKLAKYKGGRKFRSHTKTTSEEKLKCVENPVSCSNSSRKSSLSSANEGHLWSELKPFLTVNDHLEVGISDGKIKTGLEKKIEEAIDRKDFDTAVTLNDRLADRDFGAKIAAAFDAKEFAKKRKLEEEKKVAHNKKKLSWVFEHKQRWETKGNM